MLSLSFDRKVKKLESNKIIGNTSLIKCETDFEECIYMLECIFRLKTLERRKHLDNDRIKSNAIMRMAKQVLKREL